MSKEDIRQCMADVHKLALEARNADSILRDADNNFSRKKESAATATSLTDLDAMIKQVGDYSAAVCKRLAAMSAVPEGTSAAETPASKRIISVRRYDICPVRQLRSRAEIDRYVEEIRSKLYASLKDRDGVQIS